MGEIGEISPPVPLTPDHDLRRFDCGYPSMDEWLRKHAMRNHHDGASRTFVVCRDTRVVGFYSLATGAVRHRDTVGKVRRNMPEPVPVMILGRLAVDGSVQGRGIGSGLLRDAVLRTLRIAEDAGVRALLLHALDEKAKAFYLRYGFKSSPTDDLTLMSTLPDLSKALD